MSRTTRMRWIVGSILLVFLLLSAIDFYDYHRNTQLVAQAFNAIDPSKTPTPEEEGALDLVLREHKNLAEELNLLIGRQVVLALVFGGTIFYLSRRARAMS